jgi:hypothetical protein
MRKYREYSDEDLVKCASEVTSVSQLLKALGLRPAGGNYANIKRLLQKLEVNCDHWKGHAWNKDQRLKDWSEYTTVVNLKKHLIIERGHKCESCGNVKWMGYLIALEVEHIDGDRTNNDKKNLKLLCPNCHSLTPTWRGRKNGKR